MSVATTQRPSDPTSPAARPLRERAREYRDLARTTRVGRLARAGALVVALILLTGVLGLVATLRTQDAADDVVTRSGPVGASAQELYRALSDADATAAQGFLSGSAEPAALRLRYQTDVTTAGVALADAARASGSGAPGAALQTLTTGLPVYTGLVETARVTDAQGLTVGGAYLREASTFLQGTLLPAARAVYEEQSAVLDAEQDTADGDLWGAAALVGALATLVAVAALHRRVARNAKRRVTPGLVVAGGAVALVTLWGALALGTASALVTSAREHGVAPNRAVVAARFAVLQSRSDEIITLVSRGSSTQYEAAYTQRGIAVYGWAGMMDAAQAAAGDDAGVAADVDEARRAGRLGLDVHSRVRSLDVSGNFDSAVALALSPAPDGGAGAAGRVETALDRAVDTTASVAARDDAAAATVTTLLGVGVVLLTLVAAAGVVAGLGPRLQEYR